jgi:cystathionine beta-lyase
MPPYSFDTVIERRDSGSLKWTLYDRDVLPLWVADMDFPSPEPIIRALHERVDHGFYGYEFDSQPLRQVLVERMAARYGWTITPPMIQFVPNLVATLHFVCLAFAEAGDEVLMLTPAYPPFLMSPPNGGRVALTLPLAHTSVDGRLHYEIDFDAVERAITPRTKVMLLCNPHNPVGRMWPRADLERLAEIALRHNLVIISDEIHCDLILNGAAHIPMATLGPEVAARCMTLLSPSKTFNTPSLGIALTITENEDLRKRFEKVTAFYLPHPGAMGYAAALAAYTQCQDWLDALLLYLKSNRDFLVETVSASFPGVAITLPEATYLAWLDFRDHNLPEVPFKFFLERGRVALSDGAAFGTAGEGFVRLNFGTPRVTLAEALERMRAALAGA